MSRKTLVKLKSIKKGGAAAKKKVAKKKVVKKAAPKRATKKTESKVKVPAIFSDKMMNTPDRFSRIEGIIFIFGLFFKYKRFF